MNNQEPSHGVRTVQDEVTIEAQTITPARPSVIKPSIANLISDGHSALDPAVTTEGECVIRVLGGSPHTAHHYLQHLQHLQHQSRSPIPTLPTAPCAS